jgi:hypothetical protein
LNSAEINYLLQIIDEKDIEHVVVHGYSSGYDDLLRGVRSARQDIKTYSVWHGGPSQFDDKLVYRSFEHLWKLKRTGLLDKIAMVKGGMQKMSSDFFSELVFNYPPYIIKHEDVSAEAGAVLVPLRPIYRKNIYSNLLAAKMSDDVNLIYTTSKVPLFGGLLSDENIRVLNNGKGLSRYEMFEYYNRVQLVMNVTMAECQPMVFLESLSFGVPCLIGPNSFGHLDGHEYKKLIEVVRPDVLTDIINAIKNVKAQSEKDPRGLNDMMVDYSKKSILCAKQNYHSLFST